MISVEEPRILDLDMLEVSLTQLMRSFLCSLISIHRLIDVRTMILCPQVRRRMEPVALSHPFPLIECQGRKGHFQTEQDPVIQIANTVTIMGRASLLFRTCLRFKLSSYRWCPSCTSEEEEIC
jgi:hypothetical protein